MRSLRARVTLAAVAAGALIALACGVAVVSAIADAKVETLDRKLERGADRALENLFRTSIHGFSGSMYAHGAHGRVYSGLTGKVIQKTSPTMPGTIERQPSGFSFQRSGGRRWRVHVMQSNVGSERWGQPIIQVGLPTADLDAEVARARNAVIGAGALAMLLLGALVWLLAGAALAPVGRLVDGAEELSGSEDLTRRLPVEGTAEVASLAASLNRLLQRRQRSLAQTRSALEATRTFTADAGHELRTPLTSLRANLDVLARDGLDPVDRDRSLRDSLAAHARLTALIDGLQTLARGDAGVAARSTVTDLGELADAAVIDARRRHPEAVFELEGSGAAPVQGDPDGLRMLLDNLLENAALHGGRRVRVNLLQRDGYVQLSVDDDGPGVPEAEKGRVFERFARGSAARNGTGSGLGLAIAAQQAELHGSRLKLGDSPLGGARFELTLSAPGSA